LSSGSAIVVGGGLAGLSCAIALAESGWRIRLFEMRPHLGGRAASYSLPDGTEIDNCQHVTMGCCTNLEDFYRRAGAAEKIAYFDRIAFADREGRTSRIAISALPEPLHLAPSLFRFRSLGLGDKASIGRALGEILRHGGRLEDAKGVSMLEWLRQRRQSPAAIDRFWKVVLVSALDETLDRAEAQYGIDVFWKAFLSNRAGFRVGVPRVPLGDLYAGCRDGLLRRGGEIWTRARVKSFRIEEGSAVAAVFEDGAEETADAFVSAVPHSALLEMLPADLIGRESVFSGLRNLLVSPITSVHFWFDRQVMREPFLALVGLESQWIFNRSLLLAAPNGSPAQPQGHLPEAPQYLQVVISASYDLVQRSRQEIIEMVRQELGLVLPAIRAAGVTKATVVKEMAATFSPAPRVDDWRPQACSPIRQLFLAGDWTRTGWPATMEGAVRSGYLAAQAVLSSAGQHRVFLQPDLPPEGFAQIWARSSLEEPGVHSEFRRLGRRTNSPGDSHEEGRCRPSTDPKA
jgi:squalene-associated FAD-dependent desaturase